MIRTIVHTHIKAQARNRLITGTTRWKMTLKAIRKMINRDWNVLTSFIINNLEGIWGFALLSKSQFRRKMIALLKFLERRAKEKLTGRQLLRKVRM